MAGNKTKAEPNGVKAFIAAIPDARQRADCAVLVDMFARVSGEPATMRRPGMIGFGTHHYRYGSGHEGDILRFGFAPRCEEILLDGLGGAERHAGLLARMGKHRTGKRCIYLKALAGLDLGALEAVRGGICDAARGQLLGVETGADALCADSSATGWVAAGAMRSAPAMAAREGTGTRGRPVPSILR